MKPTPRGPKKPLKGKKSAPKTAQTKPLTVSQPKPLIPRDFLDDDDDSYITNLAPNFDSDEIQTLPVNLAVVNIKNLSLQFIKQNEWQGIVSLIDPLHLLGVYQLLSIAIHKTWALEEKNSFESYQNWQNEQIEAKNNEKSSQNSTNSENTTPAPPTPPPCEKPTNPNPALCIEALPESLLTEYLTFPMTEVITTQILPLFGLMIMKARYTTPIERYEYRFRLGAKPFRMQDALALMGDINLILGRPKCIEIEDIAGRLYLGLLTTMLKRNQFVTHINDDINDDGDGGMDCVDFSQLWFEMSQFEIVVNFSTKVKEVGENDNESEKYSKNPEKINQVDFQSAESVSNFFQKRTKSIFIEILNGIVINYDKNIILLTIPCQDYAIPITRPNNTPKDPKNPTNPKMTTTTTQNQQSSILGIQPNEYPVHKLNADLFGLLPNVLIAVIKAIITFKIKQSQADYETLQTRELGEHDGGIDREEKEQEEKNDKNEKNEKNEKNREKQEKIMKIETIQKFSELFKYLMANKLEFTPQNLLSTWITLTEECNGDAEQELLNKRFSNMVITPKCLQGLPTTIENKNDDQNDQNNVNSDVDSLALTVSVSLAQTYIHHGFVHANKVLDEFLF